MTWLRLVLAAAGLLAASLPAYAAHPINHDLVRLPSNAIFLLVLGIVCAVMSTRCAAPDGNPEAGVAMRLKFIVGLPLTWTVLAYVHARTGLPRSQWIAVPLWIVSLLLFLGYGQYLVPGFLRRWFLPASPTLTPTTHGSAHFGTAAIGARHLAPAAPARASAPSSRTCWPIPAPPSCWTSRARTTPSPPAPAASWGSTSCWSIRSASPETWGTR